MRRIPGQNDVNRVINSRNAPVDWLHDLVLYNLMSSVNSQWPLGTVCIWYGGSPPLRNNDVGMLSLLTCSPFHSEKDNIRNPAFCRQEVRDAIQRVCKRAAFIEKSVIQCSGKFISLSKRYGKSTEGKQPRRQPACVSRWPCKQGDCANICACGYNWDCLRNCMHWLTHR